MIDCHAHAFPALDEHLKKLPAPVGLLIQQTLGRVASELGRARRGPGRWRPTRPVIDIERLAVIRKRSVSPLPEAAELLLGLAFGPPQLLNGTTEQLRRSMDHYGITHSVVIGALPLAPNHWLLDAAQEDERLIPVAHLPKVAYGSTMAALERALAGLAERGVAGFKIHPNMDGLEPDHPAYRALFEAAQRLDRFVIIHTGRFTVAGYRRLGPADPRGFIPLFRDFPDVRVCLAHMNRDAPEVVWGLLHRFDQLYTDTSWQPAEVLRRAVSELGPTRLLLGSDWPMLHPGLQGDAAGALRRATSEEDFRLVTETNARTFLGLPAGRS